MAARMETEGRILPRAQLALALAIGVFCAVQVYSIYQRYDLRSDFLYWDPAAHAFYGVKIAVDIKSLNVLSLIKDTNDQVLWPPLHSYLQAPFMLTFGTEFRSSFLCSLAFYALFFVSATFLFQEIGISFCGWCVLMSFVATSPIYAGYGCLPMIEIFGATFIAFTISLYLRKSKHFPLALMMLFFLKYNYCLYVAASVLVFEIAKRSSQFRIHDLRNAVTYVSSFGIFVFGYLLFLLVILVTGGFKIGSLSVSGIGNPLTILVWIVLIRSVLKKDIVKYWTKIRESGWTSFVVPIFVWMLIPVPNRFRTMVDFAINKPLSGLSITDFGYYSFYATKLSLFFSNNAALIVCLLGAIVTTIAFRNTEKIKSLALQFCVPFLLLTLNQNKGERQLIPVVFLLWVLIAGGVARIRSLAIRVAVTILICFIALWHFHWSSAKAYVQWPFIPIESKHIGQYVVNEIRESGSKEVRVLGTRNDISEALLLYGVAKEANFKNVPHIAWVVERNAPVGTNIISIGSEQDSWGKVIANRVFPDGTVVTHYVLLPE